MNTRRLFSLVFILAVTFTASSALAKVDPTLAAKDPRLAPFIETTKQQGASLLPGRYAKLKEIRQRNAETKIYAPTDEILEIGRFNSEAKLYPAVIDEYGDNREARAIILDTQGPVPILRVYELEHGRYELDDEYYAVVMSEGGNKYVWICGETDDGDVSYLFPINDAWFPEGWYAGTWRSTDGKYELTFSGDDVTLQREISGKFTVKDDRISVRLPDGDRDVVYAMFNPDNRTLVVTLTDGKDGDPKNAVVFERVESAPPVFTIPDDVLPMLTPISGR